MKFIKQLPLFVLSLLLVSSSFASELKLTQIQIEYAKKNYLDKIPSLENKMHDETNACWFYQRQCKIDAVTKKVQSEDEILSSLENYLNNQLEVLRKSANEIAKDDYVLKTDLNYEAEKIAYELTEAKRTRTLNWNRIDGWDPEIITLKFVLSISDEVQFELANKLENCAYEMDNLSSKLDSLQ